MPGINNLSLNTMERIVASIGHLKAQIMPTKKGMCKVYVNFNPIDKVILLSQIFHCRAIQNVVQVTSNENGSGELLIRLRQSNDTGFLQRSLEQIFIDYLES